MHSAILEVGLAAMTMSRRLQDNKKEVLNMLRLQRLAPMPFDLVRGDLDRVFQSLARPFLDEVVSTREFPALNLWEDGDRLVAEAEVPGVRTENIEVLVVGDELTIKGNRPAPAQTNESVHRQERSTGEFERTVTLPVEIAADKVEATLRDGVLTILLPKSEPAKARKIAVQNTKD